MATQVTTIAAPTLELDQELGGCSRRRWSTWKMKWNAFATRTKLSGEDTDVQIATLVSALPDRAIEALDTLPDENQSDKKDVKKILELLKAEYLDDVNEILHESYIFFTRQQEKGEPIASYITELGRLAGTCNFGDLTERLIRDRIVCGITNKSLRKALLTRPQLKLTECIQMCKSNHASRDRAEDMTSSRGPTPINAEEADIYAMRATPLRRMPPHTGTHQAGSSQTSADKQSVSERCQYCGCAQHGQRQECPALGKSCLKCGGKNHFAKVCRQARRAVPWIAHDVGEVNATKDSDVEDSFQFVSSFNTADGAETLSTISTLKQTTVFGHFGVNGRLTSFQLDRGASCNVLREKDIDLPRQSLQPTKTK